MTASPFRLHFLLFVLAAGLLNAASADAQANVEGAWSGSWTWVSCPPEWSFCSNPGPYPVSDMVLAQVGSGVSGTAMFQQPAEIAGTVTGDSFDFEVTYPSRTDGLRSTCTVVVTGNRFEGPCTQFWMGKTGSWHIIATRPFCAHTFTAGSGASLVRYCVSEGGTITKLEGPSGQEHINADEIWEGYVVCTGTTPQAWDLSMSNSGSGSTTVLAGPTATGITLRRSSPQFQLDQAFKVDKAQKSISITTTLTNISGGPLSDVRLARAYDPDVDSGALDIEVKSVRGVWAGDANSVTLTGITWGISTDSAIDTAAAPACSPAGAAPPALTGDASLANVTYRLGNMAAGAKKKVVFVYRIQ